MGLSSLEYGCQVTVTVGIPGTFRDFFEGNNTSCVIGGTAASIGCGGKNAMTNKMQVKVCESCKGLYQTNVPSDQCPICQGITNRLFGKVKSYIRSHRSADVQEVAKACHVSAKQILKWVREERLYFDDESKVALPCLQCGTLISSGKYCEACKKKMHKTLKSVYVKSDSKERQPSTDRMVAIKTSERLRFERRP